jgi:peptidoglycan/xylan/chitin deacetylase (PgdA/CDA1 family)
MYHVIQKAPPGAPNPDLFVAADTFAAEVQALAQRGYHGVTLDQAWAYWKHGVPLPPKPVVLSFDDGYFSQSKNAAATLAKVGWPGVLFLKTDALATAGGLNVTEIKRMIRAGWEIDPHTITHPDLTAVGDAQLQHEVAGSRAILRRDFGVPANFFAYPSGRHDARVIAAVRGAGMEGAVTVDPGIATPRAPYEMPRVRVHATDTPASLLARIAS